MANLNIFPVGSVEWLEDKLNYFIPIIERQIKEQAVARGINPEDPIVEEMIRREVEKVRQQLAAQGSEYQFNREEAEKNRQAQMKMAEEQAKRQERAALYSGLGNIAAFSLFNRPFQITPEGKVETGKTGFEKLKELFSPSQSETGNLTYTKPQTFGLPVASGLLGGLVSGKSLGSSSVLVPTALSTVGSNLFSQPISPTWSSLASFLGAAFAPKEGLFKKGKDLGKSLFSLASSTAPIWGRLAGLF